MSKQKIKIIITTIVILAALICLLPIPKRIEKDYYAVDTFSEEKSVISVDITYLNFLFLKDKMVGNIKVFDGGEIYEYDSNHLIYVGKWPSNNQDKFIHSFNGFYLNPAMYWGKSGEVEGSQIIGFELVFAYMSRDFNKILIYHQEDDEVNEGQSRQDVGLESAQSRQYVGSIEKNGISDSIKCFEGFVRENLD